MPFKVGIPQGFRLKRVLMDEDSMGRTLRRMVHEILERSKGGANLALVGVRRRGDVLASRMSEAIEGVLGMEVPLGVLDITLYRDDLRMLAQHPKIGKTEIPFPMEGKQVVLIDDVIFTGRTTRAALDAIMDLGRPKSVQLAVLIDRGHRELPIQPDYVGRKVPTSIHENVLVLLREVDGVDQVVLVEEENAEG